MTTIDVHEILSDIEPDDHAFSMWMHLAVGSGSIDPELIAPRDGQEGQQVEDLIAFRCSCL